MARRPNYGFEKRQKELKKQEKKDEKAERKRLKKEAEERGEVVDEAWLDGDDTEDGDADDSDG